MSAGGYVPIPDMPGLDGLPPKTFQVYFRLRRRAWTEAGDPRAPVRASRAVLTELLGFDERQIREHLSRLREAHMLKYSAYDGEYEITFIPPDVQKSAETPPHSAETPPTLPQEPVSAEPVETAPTTAPEEDSAETPPHSAGSPPTSAETPPTLYGGGGIQDTNTKEIVNHHHHTPEPPAKPSRRKTRQAAPEPLPADRQLLADLLLEAGVFYNPAICYARERDPRDVLGWVRHYQDAANRAGLQRPVGAVLTAKLRDAEPAPTPVRPRAICASCGLVESACACAEPALGVPIAEYVQALQDGSPTWGICRTCHALVCRCPREEIAEIAADDDAPPPAADAAPAPAWPDGPVADTWQTALGQLALQMTRATFDTWVKNSHGLAFQDGVFVVGVTNGYARDWLEHRLHPTIKRTLTGLLNCSVDVHYVVWTPAQAGAA